MSKDKVEYEFVKSDLTKEQLKEQARLMNMDEKTRERYLAQKNKEE